MNLPTAAEEYEKAANRVERDMNNDPQDIDGADLMTLIDAASQFAAFLRSPDTGEVEALENVPVTVIDGCRYVPDSAYDRALDLTRRLAAQLATARDLPCCDARE